METKGLPLDPPGREDFNQNRGTHSYESIQPYFEHLVAWQADGTRIVAAIRGNWELLPKLEEQLIQQGIDPSQVVLEYVTDPEIGYL